MIELYVKIGCVGEGRPHHFDRLSAAPIVTINRRVRLPLSRGEMHRDIRFDFEGRFPTRKFSIALTNPLLLFPRRN
jgi:hypothetical protein